MRRITLGIKLVLCLSCTPALAADITQLDANKIAQYGIASFKKGDYQTAIKYLSARIKMKQEDPNAYYYLGNCYLKTKQNDLAAHMFSLCVRVSPASQAGKYSLTALETLSTMPKALDTPPPVDKTPDPAQAAAIRDALLSEKPLDQAFNDAVVKIKSYRQTLKTKVDHCFLQMQDEMQALQQKNNPTYAADLERIQRETENKVQDLQTKELRLESRLMAPDKIDIRAIPQIPTEKIDDTKTALASLLDYFKPDKPFDPFGTDINPELTSKFMTIKDLFGELSTYQASARKLSKQVFAQLKNSIEIKQDSLDRELYELKENLIHDVVTVKINYGNVASQRINQVTVASFVTGAKLPRNDQDQLTPQEIEIKQAVERSKKRIKEIEDTYYRNVESLISDAKEKLGGMVAQTGQMNSQLKKPSGNIQLVPLGTDTYTRNYINFGDRPELSSPSTNTKLAPAPAAQLRVEATKLQVKALKAGRTSSSTQIPRSVFHSPSPSKSNSTSVEKPPGAAE